jgi:hypothetical protein
VSCGVLIGVRGAWIRLCCSAQFLRLRILMGGVEGRAVESEILERVGIAFETNTAAQEGWGGATAM